MKDYTFNKQPKDPRMLATFRKIFNLERIENGFSTEEAANELGMTYATLDQKLKSAADARLTWDEVDHQMGKSKKYDVLELQAFKHGFKLVKLNLDEAATTVQEINSHADAAMKESSEAWAKIKAALDDEKLTKKEKNELLREINEAVKAFQQAEQDILNKEIEE